MRRPTTTLSTKGQVILPVDLRRRRGWSPGAVLLVEETEEGVLLRPVPVAPVRSPADVFGMLRRAGPPLSIEAMERAVQAEAWKRHDRG